MSDRVSAGVIEEATLNSLFLYDAVVDAGATAGNVYASIDAAIDDDASSIFVKPGIYSGFTADENNLRIVCEMAEEESNGFKSGVIIDGKVTVSGNGVSIENMCVMPDGSNDAIDISGAQVWLKNCIVAYGPAGSSKAAIDISGDKVWIINCQVKNTVGYAGIIVNGTHNFILNNLISNNVDDGIYVDGDALYAVIYGNIIRNNSAYGIEINTECSDDALIVGNVIYGNSSGIISGEDYYPSTITNANLTV